MQINYDGVRWQLFSRIATELNPDLSEIPVTQGKMKDPAWRDLRSVMHHPFLDPLVQAVADMTGSDFRVVRSTALRSIKELSEKRLDVSRRFVIKGLLDVDPHLAAWFVVSELDGACRAILDNEAAVEAVSTLSFPAMGAITAVSGYAQRMLRTFSMSSAAAQSEVIALAVETGLDSVRQIASQRQREFRERLMVTQEFGDTTPTAFAIRRVLSAMVSKSISLMSTVWDLDGDLVDQIESWEDTSQRPSRAFSVGLVERNGIDDEVDSLTVLLTTALDAERIRGMVQDMPGRSLRHALNAIEAYPPTPTPNAS